MDSSVAVSTGAAAAAQALQASRASGVVVRVDPDVFLEIVERQAAPLVVEAGPRFLFRRYGYLCGYKGLMFSTQSITQLPLPDDCEVVEAKVIWLPN